MLREEMNTAVNPPHLDDRLDELLRLWVLMMRGNDVIRALWYPDGACGCIGGGNSRSFDEMCEEMDNNHAQAVGAAIESLSPAMQCAIFHIHLNAVYRFRAPVEELYQQARNELRIVLLSKHIY